jgi:hypothetical protein
MIGHNESLSTVITHYSPFVTPEKYAEMSGLSVNAVVNAIQTGKLPVIRRENGRRGRSYINMRALEQYALEQAEENQHWKNSI